MRFLILYIWATVSVLAQTTPADTTHKTILMHSSVEDLDTTTYHIKTGDRLRIRNLNSLDLIYPQNAGSAVGGANLSGQSSANNSAYETTVDRRGQIMLPQVGRVKVGGLSKIEAMAEVERSYQNLIANPIFEIEIINLQVKALGAFNKQGIFPLEKEKITLGELIAMAGGIDFTTADKSIKLIRSKNYTQQEINFDIRNLNDPTIANVLLFDGDYIFIPPSKGSLRSVKNQRISSILQPVALTLNALAVILGVYLSLRATK